MKHRDLMNQLGYQFKDISLLDLALSHRSSGKFNNERLEFLGDSLLNFIIAKELYQKFPDAQEGQLSRLRAHMVKEETLAKIAKELNIGESLNLGMGELKSGGASRASILADSVEAIIAALYLDSNIDTCFERLKVWYRSRIDDLSLTNVHKDPKSKLQELLQAQKLPIPEYHLIDTQGAEHKQCFVVECQVALLEEPIKAEGSSRRKAEQKAAQKILEELKRGNRS